MNKYAEKLAFVFFMMIISLKAYSDETITNLNRKYCLTPDIVKIPDVCPEMHHSISLNLNDYNDVFEAISHDVYGVFAYSFETHALPKLRSNILAQLMKLQCPRAAISILESGSQTIRDILSECIHRYVNSYMDNLISSYNKYPPYDNFPIHSRNQQTDDFVNEATRRLKDEHMGDFEKDILNSLNDALNEM